MKNCYLVITLFFLLFSRSAQAQADWYYSGPKVIPFEDYSKCQVGFLTANLGRRDTLFQARFENLTPLGVTPYYNAHNQGQATYERFGSTPGWIVSENGKFGFITFEGKIGIPFQYEKLTYARTDKAFEACLNGKCGLVSEKDSVLIPIQYDAVHSSIDGSCQEFITVSSGAFYGVYAINRKEVVPPVFDVVEPIIVYGELKQSPFFIVKKNGRSGVMDDDGKWVVPMEFIRVEMINGNSPTEAESFFSGLDSTGHTIVFDESGRRIGEPILGNCYPIYSKLIDGYPTGTDFIAIRDTSETQQAILNVHTGKRTPFFEFINLYRHHFFYGTYEFCEGVMDTNFNVIATIDSGRQLHYFENNRGLNDIQSYSELYDTESSSIEVGDVKRKFGKFHEPNVLVWSLEKESVKLKRKYYSSETTYFSLWNLETGKRTPYIYNHVHRMISSTDGVYFWAVHNNSEDVRHLDQNVAIDIYDSLGTLVNKICMDQVEFRTVIQENYEQPKGVFLVQSADNVWTVQCVDGTQLSKTQFQYSSDFRFKPWIWKELGQHAGVIQINVPNGFWFMDYQGKPLLNGRTFHNSTFRQFVPGYNSLKDSNGYVIVGDDLSVVMDSCSNVIQFGSEVSYALRRSINGVVIKNNQVFCYFNERFQLLDSTFFIRTFERQRLAKDIWVDSRGTLLFGTDEELSAQMYLCGNLYIGKFGKTLRIENDKRELILEIPNVKEYHPSSSLITVVTTTGKTGKFRTSTASWAIPPIYTEIRETTIRGIFFARDSVKEKWCLVDSLGNRKTPNTFDHPFSFSQDKLNSYFYSDRKIGIINRDFSIEIPPRFDSGKQLRRSFVLHDYTGNYLLRDSSSSVFKLENGFVDSDQFNRYLYVTRDSVWVRDREGNLLLPPTLRSYVEEHINLGAYLIPEIPATQLPQVHGLFILCNPSDTALVKLNTKLLLDYADLNIINQAFLWKTDGVPYEQRQACYHRPIWINDTYYSERLDGSCEVEKGYEKQEVWFRVYEMKGDSTELIGWRDLFVDPVAAEVEISALIEKQIQVQQLFGTTCADMPAAVAEIKRNYYLNGPNLYFMHMPRYAPVIVQLHQIKTPLKHPECFPPPVPEPRFDPKLYRSH